MTDSKSFNRRPLATRSHGWAKALARRAAEMGLTPNAISLLGIIAALGGAGAMLLATADPLWWLAAAIGIQVRLLANMLDGLVAVEAGQGTPTGPLFNEIPDRIEDTALLVTAGYAIGQPAIGWAAALLAMATAYLRAVGGSLGFAQDFSGPMAKQHRMAVLTLGAVAATVLAAQPVMVATLSVIVAGSVMTCLLRTLRLARILKEA